MSTSAALADVRELLDGMSDADIAAIDKQLEPELTRHWKPTPGPQLDAYLCDADLLLYGGAAGGGKTDLIAGLATCEHEKSVIFRRQASDLDGFWERLTEIADPILLSNDSNKKKLRTKDGRLIEGGHLEKPGSEKSWQGRPHDLIGFDEGAQLTPIKVNFVLGWLRSATGKRCRAVIGSNPPLAGDGQWLIEWFAPWLDPLFKDKALHGELRWAYMVGEGDQLTTVWVDEGDTLVEEVTGGRYVLMDGKRKAVLSRTFIPSKLDDNPYLNNTNYRAQIDAMPEPMRSQLLHGDFLAGQDDHKMQVIPTEWVNAAQARWRETNAKTESRLGMLALSADIAMGGADKTVIACLCESAFFEELVTYPGRECKDGATVAGYIANERRDGADLSVDLTGGWGASVRDHFVTHMNTPCVGLVASEKSGRRPKKSKLGFLNQRAEWWWMMREALDPESGENVKLPPSAKLKAELTAPRWKLKGTNIQIESKDDLRVRLGSSTDHADAVLQAWSRRGSAEVIKARRMDNNNISRNEDLSDPLRDF